MRSIVIRILSVAVLLIVCTPSQAVRYVITAETPGSYDATMKSCFDELLENAEESGFWQKKEDALLPFVPEGWEGISTQRYTCVLGDCKSRLVIGPSEGKMVVEVFFEEGTDDSERARSSMDLLIAVLKKYYNDLSMVVDQRQIVD